ncbi:MAG: uracil-DNA glycosylase, partial [Chitinispirillales bacterium]|nr:uracil-DNA glycosylase [Chitinispirillales bacterium]
MYRFDLIEKYFVGQKESGIPNDIVLDEKFNFYIQNAPIKKSVEKMKIENIVSQEKTVFMADETKTEVLRKDFEYGEQKVGAEYDKREELAKLYYRCSNCVACSLAKTRKKFVFGAGTAFTDIMVIGEAPGEQEDLQGKPFVGAAGELLTKMLAAIHIERKDIFIANILKCRPPMNRTPNQPEVAACIPILKKQIEIIKPKALLLLGKTAANNVLQNDKSVGSLRGIVHYFDGIPAIVSYHPSALLREEKKKK